MFINAKCGSDSKISCKLEMHEKFTSEIQLNTSKRLARLEYLRAQLEGGSDVAKRDLKNALTEAEWLSYEERRKNELESRNVEMPKELKKYASLKKNADLAFSRAQAYYSRNPMRVNHTKNYRMYEIHSDLNERAMEYLRERLGVNRSLRAWLDSGESFDSVSKSIDAMVLPKLITTRTHRRAATSPEPRFSIRDMKLDAIESALLSISSDASEEAPWPEIKKTKRDFSKIKV